MTAVADLLECIPVTVRAAVHRFEKGGLAALPDAPRPGRPARIPGPEDRTELADLWTRRPPQGLPGPPRACVTGSGTLPQLRSGRLLVSALQGEGVAASEGHRQGDAQPFGCATPVTHLGPGPRSEGGEPRAAAARAVIVSQPLGEHGRNDGPRLPVASSGRGEVVAGEDEFFTTARTDALPDRPCAAFEGEPARNAHVVPEGSVERVIAHGPRGYAWSARGPTGTGELVAATMMPEASQAPASGPVDSARKDQRDRRNFALREQQPCGQATRPAVPLRYAGSDWLGIVNRCRTPSTPRPCRPWYGPVRRMPSPRASG
ncbi:MAG: helix-turn-helix domain-containing protein [Streptomyces sp.]|nr:helix-turn-helix domain-containing protein [Streptomyces sp.]